jgi:hypothetical protein
MLLRRFSSPSIKNHQPSSSGVSGPGNVPWNSRIWVGAHHRSTSTSGDLKPPEMIAAALGVRPDDDIVWAMLVHLLFGPAGHEDLTRLPAGRAGERKGQREQAKTLAVPSSSVQCQVDHLYFRHRGPPECPAGPAIAASEAPCDERTGRKADRRLLGRQPFSGCGRRQHSSHYLGKIRRTRKARCLPTRHHDLAAVT